MKEAPENVKPEDVADVEATVAMEPTPVKSPHVAPQARNVAPSRAKAGKQGTAAKKAGRGKKAAKPVKNAPTAKQGSKTAKFLGLLKRAGGATGADLMKAAGWQAHSVRGFLSGVIARKMGLTVTSTKAENGVRRYSVKS